jgi:tellurite resistance protein TerC
MMDTSSPWLWFNAFLAVMLALDLGVFNKRAHRVSAKEAMVWTGVWVSLAVAFNIGVYYFMGAQRGLEWTTGYLIEYALSVDNVFVFALLIASFGVPEEYRHRLLFLGVISAIIMRLSIILLGAYLVEHWHWIFYFFGLFLIFTGARMFSTEEEFAPRENAIVQWIQRRLPLTDGYVGGKLFVKNENRLLVTPLLMALVSIEVTDLIFAMDSIPAIFAITQDPFIVYTSNAFAVLGLRSLYFLLADALGKFHYLKHGLGIVLAMVGVKMLLRDVVHVPVLWSLIAIVVVLAASVVYSLRHPPKQPTAEPADESRRRSKVR